MSALTPVRAADPCHAVSDPVDGAGHGVRPGTLHGPVRGTALLGPALLGAPCRSPRHPVRIGRVPRPRVRPLADVLAELVRPAPEPAPPAVADDPDTRNAAELARQEELVRAARPAAVRVLGALAEILDGHRPPSHLRGLCDESLYAGVVAGLAPPRRATTRARVGGVRVCGVAGEAVEVATAVHGAGRARAVGARLERTPRGWRLAALVVG